MAARDVRQLKALRESGDLKARMIWTASPDSWETWDSQGLRETARATVQNYGEASGWESEQLAAREGLGGELQGLLTILAHRLALDSAGSQA